MDILSFMIMVACVLVPSLKVSKAVDSISVSQSISDGKTLVSQGGTFELGFFSPGYSKKRYLGIWYKNIPIQTVVWVANRVKPVNDSTGILTVNSTGNLVLSQNGSIVWDTTSQKQAQNPVAELLDSGNLVVRVTSWKSPDDPSPGDVSLRLMLYNYPEFYMMKGTEKFYRMGPWNGLYASGLPEEVSNSLLDFKFVTNSDEVVFSYSLNNKSVTSIVVLNQTKVLRYIWDEQYQNWRIYTSLPRDYCDTYGLCGAYGNCIITQTQVCQCLNGFSPKSPQAWIQSDWTQGCVRNIPLSCKDKHTDGFVNFVGLKVPDTTHTWLNETMGLEECRDMCLNNCSCMAYTNSNISGAGSGCVMWFGDLIDMRQFEAGGQDLYIRMPASELGPEYRGKKNTRTIVATTIASICGVLLLCTFFIWRVRRKIAVRSQRHVDDLDLPLFDLPTIATATNDFSIKNKIGEGGFGQL